MNLEDQIIGTVHSSIAEAIKTKLSGYNTPLDNLIKQSIEKNAESISSMLNDAVAGCLIGDFRAALQDACAKKLAKVIISKAEGEIEKQANELRSSPEFRAKLTIAITDTIKSFK